MTKIKKCVSIDENNGARVSRVAAGKGLSESEIIDKYISLGLRNEPELTSVERFSYQRDCIEKSLDSILRVFGILDMRGSLTDKFRHSLYVSQGINRLKNRQVRNGIIELSIFEVLNAIKDMDKNLFEELLTDMSKFGKIRLRYLSLYKK